MDLAEIFAPSKDAVSLIVCGRSGSGKTCLLKHLCRIKNQKTVILSGGTEFNDLPNTEILPLHRNINALRAVGFPLRNCTVVCDDFIKVSDKEHDFLRQLVMWTKRHQNVNILLAVHTFVYTKVGLILNQMDYVCFTSAASNPDGDQNVRKFMQQVKPDNLKMSTFATIPSHGYLLFNTRTQEHVIMDKNFDSPEDDLRSQNKKDSISREILKILRAFPDYYHFASCHLAFVLRNISVDIIDPRDFSITLRRRRAIQDDPNAVTEEIGRSDEGYFEGGPSNTSTAAGQIRVSLVDYLLAAQRSNHCEEEILLLHDYFSRNFKVPSAIIKNSFMA